MTNLTIEEYFDVTQRYGWSFCKLLRDIYMCKGERYEKILAQTASFDVDRFGLDKLPERNTNFGCWQLALAPVAARCALPFAGRRYCVSRGTAATHTFFTCSGRARAMERPFPTASSLHCSTTTPNSSTRAELLGILAKRRSRRHTFLLVSSTIASSKCRTKPNCTKRFFPTPKSFRHIIQHPC